MMIRKGAKQSNLKRKQEAGAHFRCRIIPLIQRQVLICKTWRNIQHVSEI